MCLLPSRITLLLLLARQCNSLLTRTFEIGTSQATYITNISVPGKAYFSFFIPYTTAIYVIDAWDTGLSAGRLSSTYTVAGNI